jgi:integrase
MLANRAWAIVNGQGDAPTVVRAVIEVMMLNACRISEVLKISGHNITDTGQIYVKGSKKSHNRLLLVAVHRDFWMLRKNFTEKLGDIYTRYFFYHRFKALGLQSSLTGNSKNAVTHVFRHMVIENLKGIEVETRDTQRYVGHKSRTTTEGYETKELL